MRPFCILRAVRLFDRRQRCSSFPVTIPTAEVRRCRQQIGLASKTVQAPGRPSGRRVGQLAFDNRTSAPSALSSRALRFHRW
jgi:hypothetical protein